MKIIGLKHFEQRFQMNKMRHNEGNIPTQKMKLSIFEKCQNCVKANQINAVYYLQFSRTVYGLEQDKDTPATRNQENTIRDKSQTVAVIVLILSRRL